MAKVLFDYELMSLLQDIDKEAATRLNTAIKTALNEAADTVVRHFGTRHVETIRDGDRFLVHFCSDGPTYPREVSAYDPDGLWVELYVDERYRKVDRTARD